MRTPLGQSKDDCESCTASNGMIKCCVCSRGFRELVEVFCGPSDLDLGRQPFAAGLPKPENAELEAGLNIDADRCSEHVRTALRSTTFAAAAEQNPA